MKPVLIEDDTQKAFVQYCKSKGLKVQVKATEVLAKFLLIEAGGVA